MDLKAACNALYCCQPEHYSPLCGSDGTMYYSPCYAGCPAGAGTDLGGQKVSVVTAHCPALVGDPGKPRPLCDQQCCWAPQVYQGCSCVLEVPSGLGNATAGKCASTCQRKPLLLVLVFLVIVFTFLSSIPALTATLR